MARPTEMEEGKYSANRSCCDEAMQRLNDPRNQQGYGYRDTGHRCFDAIARGHPGCCAHSGIGRHGSGAGGLKERVRESPRINLLVESRARRLEKPLRQEDRSRERNDEGRPPRSPWVARGSVQKPEHEYWKADHRHCGSGQLVDEDLGCGRHVGVVDPLGVTVRGGSVPVHVSTLLPGSGVNHDAHMGNR